MYLMVNNLSLPQRETNRAQSLFMHHEDTGMYINENRVRPPVRPSIPARPSVQRHSFIIAVLVDERRSLPCDASRCKADDSRDSRAAGGLKYKVYGGVQHEIW